MNIQTLGNIWPGPDAAIPKALYASAEPVAVFDPAAMGTLWQDVAGTVPALLDGAVVMRMNDPGPGGRHLIQADAAKAWTLRVSGTQRWLEWSGDKWMAVGWPFTGAASLMISMAIEHVDASGVAIAIRHNGGFTGFDFPVPAVARALARSSVNTSGVTVNAPVSYAGSAAVYTQTLGDGLMSMRRNGAPVGEVACSGTILNSTNYLYMGAAGQSVAVGSPADPGTRPWTARFYGAVVSTHPGHRALAVLAQVERWLGDKIRYRQTVMDVLIALGQSNTDGRGLVANGPVWVQDSLIDGVEVWSGSEILPNFNVKHDGLAQNGSSATSGGSAGKFGPAEVAAKLLADARGKVTVCKLTNGDTALSPAYSVRGSWNADYASIAAGTPHLLEMLEARYAALLAWAAARGIRVNPLAAVMHQGESDAGTPEDAAAYLSRLTAVKATLRRMTGRPDLPFIIGTVSTISGSFNATIRAAHLAVSDGDPKARCIDMGAAALLDGVHFNEASILTLGTAWAAAVQELT